MIKLRKNNINNKIGINLNLDRNRVTGITGMAPDNFRRDETYKFNERRRFIQHKKPYESLKKDSENWSRDKTGFK
jgi:hypothetical protein